MAATEVGTLFLDLNLRIHRFTPRLADLFSVTPGDQGRPIGDFTHRLDYDRLEADARQVLEQLMHLEREVRSRDNRWYFIRFRPYRMEANKIAGVVITFVDITERKQAEEEVSAARVYAESIVETLHEALLVLTPDLRVKSANPAFYEQFRVRPQETEGRLIYELGNNQWDIPDLRVLLEDVLPENKIFTDYEVSHYFEDIGQRTMRLNGRRLDHVQLILLALEDVTERKQAEEALRKLNTMLETRVTERTEQVRQGEAQIRQMASRLTLAEQEERRRISQLLHDDLQQLLYGIQLKIGFINQSLETGEQEQLLIQAEQAITLIDNAITKIRQLTVDLSPPVLPQEGLAEALGWLVTQMQELHGLQVQLEAEQSFPLADDSLRVLLFQVIRELLFNVVKHAKTDRATVTLREEAGQLVIGINDNGRGFEVETAGTGREHGFGLRSMHERLDLVSGRMEIESQPGQGTKVTVFAPLTPPQGPIPGR
jgi:PAS domain S-box-containing protein